MRFLFKLPLGKGRAQVSAPIELFVAVIILTMTLALGLKVIGDVQEGKCIADLKTQTQSLKDAMLEVSLNSAGTKKSLYFKFPSCGQTRVVGLQFVLYLSPEYCRLCQGNYGYCWQVVPVARDPSDSTKFIQVSDAISCVNMAGDIQISSCSSSAQYFSDTPCLKDASGNYVGGSCNPVKYGLTSNIWTDGAANNPSKWSTLSALSAGSYAFNLNLTKTTTLASGSERGSIEICASKITN